MTLRSTLSTAEGKRRYVRRLFATIADRYDFITRFLSYGQDRRWKQRLIELATLTPDDRVLDLACGTGDILFAAAPRVRRAVGLDVTHRMLQLAQRRSQPRTTPLDDPRGVPSDSRGTETQRHREANTSEDLCDSVSLWPGSVNTALVTGDMMALPFAAARFTVVTTGYGLRNVPGIEGAIAEIQRVLVPGGRLLSLDFNRPENRVVRAAYLIYLTAVGSALGFALHRDPDTYRYIPESIRNYPGARGVARMLEQHGFTDVRVIPVLGGLMAIHVATKAEKPS